MDTGDLGRGAVVHRALADLGSPDPGSDLIGGWAAHLEGIPRVTTTSIDPPESRIFTEMFDAICANVEKVIHGKSETVRLAVTCLVAGGHLLIEDVPGVGKTALAKSLARSIHGEFGRVQFTPDLLPSDVLGTSVWNQNAGTFEFRTGPVFSNLLLADEVNRASPKTQSALLESMAENHVTIDGATYPLPDPFMVIATQNPLEHQGTYPLPESQLDRFLMQLSVGYPDRKSELTLLLDPEQPESLPRLKPVATTDDVTMMSRAASSVHVSDQLAGYLVDLAHNSRRSGDLALGISPRALLGLLSAAKVHAAASGRNYVTPDDIKYLAVHVLAHRVVVSANARLAGVDARHALSELLSKTAVVS
ncbi:MAG: MoxR family ATPase [Microthrixaceae bacterium]